MGDQADAIWTREGVQLGEVLYRPVDGLTLEVLAVKSEAFMRADKVGRILRNAELAFEGGMATYQGAAANLNSLLAERREARDAYQETLVEVDSMLAPAGAARRIEKRFGPEKVLDFLRGLAEWLQTSAEPAAPAHPEHPTAMQDVPPAAGTPKEG